MPGKIQGKGIHSSQTFNIYEPERKCRKILAQQGKKSKPGSSWLLSMILPFPLEA